MKKSKNSSELVKTKNIKDKEIVIIYLSGNLVGSDETDEFRDIIKNLSISGNKKLIIDLGDLLYFNSTAIAILISALKNYADRDSKIKLCRLSSNTMNILIMSKLSLIFDSYTTEEEAIKSFD